VNKERLLKLAEVLETESRGRVLTVPGNGKIGFDLGVYAFHDDENRTHGCGTAACALGYAGLHPWFRRRGVKTDIESGDVKFPGGLNVDAAAVFFDIPRQP